jgi:hypothetical protein
MHGQGPAAKAASYDCRDYAHSRSLVREGAVFRRAKMSSQSDIAIGLRLIWLDFSQDEWQFLSAYHPLTNTDS